MIQSFKDMKGEISACAKKKSDRAVIGEVGGGGRDATPSGQAFRWALKALRNGLTEDQIEQGLLRWVGDHEPSDWIPRTVYNARSVLSGSARRYRATGGPTPLAWTGCGAAGPAGEQGRAA